MTEQKEKKEIKVAALKNGTVIDHIRSEETFKVRELLNLEEEAGMVILASNLPSKRMGGKKGIIKIADRRLSNVEFNKIAIISPEATISIIDNYKIKEKVKVQMPDQIVGVIKCSNPNCITNKEVITQRFQVVSRKPLSVLCTYCERTMERKEIHLL